MKVIVDGRSVVVAVKGAIWCNLREEAAILDVESGIYYLLNSVGARTWQLIQEPRTVAKICQAMLEEYDVEPERCKRELLALITDMAEKGLIEVKNDDRP